MNENHHYFAIDGLWENKMQNIIYDYLMNSGPLVLENGHIKDLRQGYHKSVGQRSKSTTYDLLGYVDRDTEKWYASWGLNENKDDIKVKDTIQFVNIYGKLYDI